MKYFLYKNIDIHSIQEYLHIYTLTSTHYVVLRYVICK